MGKIFSTGHSNKSIEQFLKELKDNDIGLLVDVRSQPYSRYVPQYNRENLKASLEDEGIKYLYFGDKLGGRPPEGLDTFIGSARFKENVTALLEIIKDANAAIMCSEADQEQCHRRYIVEELQSRGLNVKVLHKESKHGPEGDNQKVQRQLTLRDL